MAIEIVDFPIKNSDFPVRYVSHYQKLTSLQWLPVGRPGRSPRAPRLDRFATAQAVFKNPSGHSLLKMLSEVSLDHLHDLILFFIIHFYYSNHC